MGLIELGAQMLMRAGIPAPKAHAAILAPIPSTLAQYGRLGEKAWTGPLARGDLETVSKHLVALEKLPPHFLETYQVLGQAALASFQVGRAGKHQQLAQLLRSRRPRVSKT